MPKANLVKANSVNRALNEIGDRWSLLILGYAFQGVHRFSDWRAAIGIASNILSDRLKKLVDNGCLTKVVYDEKPSRSEYRLSPKGIDLYPLALMVWRFERRWGAAKTTGGGTLVHTSCGRSIFPTMECKHCRAEAQVHDIGYHDGPGAGFDPKAPPRMQRRSNVSAEQSNSTHTLFGEAIDLLGNRWTQMVLATVFQKKGRYDEIQQELKIATNILADRLKRLVNDGILQQRLYREAPDRYEYVLTPKGRDLYPMIMAMNHWGDKWLSGNDGAPLIFTHKPCGKEFVPVIACNHCDEDLDPHSVKFTPAKL